jgi:hypothetical protein
MLDYCYIFNIIVIINTTGCPLSKLSARRGCIFLVWKKLRRSIAVAIKYTRLLIFYWIILKLLRYYPFSLLIFFLLCQMSGEFYGGELIKVFIGFPSILRSEKSRVDFNLNLLKLLVTWYTNSLTFNNCTFCPTHCIYVFCIYMRTNSDLCHLQHKLIGFYNRDEKCLLCGTNWGL